jgi:hypothetical protein
MLGANYPARGSILERCARRVLRHFLRLYFDSVSLAGVEDSADSDRIFRQILNIKFGNAPKMAARAGWLDCSAI